MLSMSTKAKAHSTASTEEHSDHNLDFVQVGAEPIANVRNNDYDTPQEHIYSVQFEIVSDGAGVTVRAISCSCPSDKYHDGPCKHRMCAMDMPELLAKILLTLASEN